MNGAVARCCRQTLVRGRPSVIKFVDYEHHLTVVPLSDSSIKAVHLHKVGIPEHHFLVKGKLNMSLRS